MLRTNSPQRLRAAFTAIELMISLALALGILLVAVSGFRMAAASMGRLERLSVENNLLRSGYLMLMEDVDFWHSHANPEYPYRKGFMSDEVEIAGDRGNNHVDKRLFKPVEFQTGRAAYDPNWLQPNDRRSWYRNHSVQSPNPMSFDKSEASFRQRVVFAQANRVEQTWHPNLAPGWEPWHVVGDYAKLANVAADAGGDPDDPIANARPLLTWNVFKSLGHVGVYTYLPPGTPNLILRPSDNLTTAAIGDPARNYDKGEVPWSLSTPQTGADGAFKPGTVTVPTFTDNVRGHYFFGMPGRGGLRHDYKDSMCGGGVWKGDGWEWRPATARVGTSEPFWLADLEQINGDYDQSIGLVIGNRLVAADLAGSRMDAGPLVDRPMADPWRSFGRVAPPNTDIHTRASDDIAYWQQERDFTSTTIHLPRNPTDRPNPELADLPVGTPGMGTGILRLRLRGGDRAACTVRLIDSTGGLVHELGFTAIGTTLRGARQHWGWKTHFDRPRLKDMGDTYDR